MTPGDESYYEYDREGSRTALVMPGIGYRVDYQYDANHRPIRMATNEGEVWYFNYDAANRRTSVVYPDGSVKFTFYDLAGQIIEEWAREHGGRHHLPGTKYL